jgi:hypothetical protein
MSRSSLVKVPDPEGSEDRPVAAPSSDPLVGGLELLEGTDQGITPVRHTNDGSDPSRRVDSGFARVFGVYPIFSSCALI